MKNNYKVIKQAISKELADFVYSYFLTKRQLIFVIVLIDIFFLFSSLKKETNKFPFDDIHFLPYCPLPFD